MLAALCEPAMNGGEGYGGKRPERIGPRGSQA